MKTSFLHISPVVLQWFGSVPSHRICQSLAQQLAASEGALQRQQMVHQQRVAAQQAAATQEIVHLNGVGMGATALSRGMGKIGSANHAGVMVFHKGFLIQNLENGFHMLPYVIMV